jgi:hypothetical protein
MGTLINIAGYGLSFVALLALYIWVNDRRLTAHPPSVASLAERPRTVESVKRLAEDMAKRNGTANSQEEEMKRQVPPKTGRKYIVTGGVSSFPSGLRRKKS